MSARLDAGIWPEWPRPGASRASLVVLLALVAWAPVPLGSNRGWSEAALAGGVLALAFAVLVGALWRGAAPLPRLAPAPVVLMGAAAAFALLQMVPLPPGALALISAGAREAWQAAGVSGAASISLDRGASAATAVHLASLAALLAITPWCVSSARRLTAACALVVVLGVAEALCGIGLELATRSGLLPSHPVEGVGGASGTFVNPNHFAGFLEMTLCVSLGLTLSLWRPAALPVSGREAADRLLGFALSPRLVLAAAQLVMLVALLWSGSRGALLALAVALPLLFAGVLPPAPGAGLAARAGALGGAALVLVAAIASGGSGSLGEKLASQGLASNRAELAAATLRMAGDFPIAGTGAGSFASVFPAYKTPVLGTAYYRHAHNDFLEILAEGGVIGAGLYFGAVAAALAGALARARRRRSQRARALTAGCAAAAASLLVHGLYDFNLQIPANASLFVFVLALAQCASALPRDHTEDARS